MLTNYFTSWFKLHFGRYLKLAPKMFPSNYSASVSELQFGR